MVIVKRYKVGSWMRMHYYDTFVDGKLVEQCDVTMHRSLKDASTGCNPKHRYDHETTKTN